MKVVLISACLAGLHTRYDGASSPHPLLRELRKSCLLVPVCPEILGGLGIPRSPCRFTGGDGKAVLTEKARVFDREGMDRTAMFVKGAEETRRLVELVSPVLIFFKEGSPSCGVHRVDIDGKKEEGCGIAVALLRDRGIPFLTEEDPLP
jgi:uncharacterized protein YbbK (DUF523 family)